MNLTQEDVDQKERDLLASIGVEQTGELCNCLQLIVGPDKGPEDLHAEDADKAIAVLGMEGGSVLLAAMHVLVSISRAGIADRILKEAAEDAAKVSFIQQLMSAIAARSGRMPGMRGMPGFQVVELGPQDFERRDGTGEHDMDEMRDGIL